MSDIAYLSGVVEQAFNRAIESPDIRRWKSVSIVAGCAAVRMAADDKPFLAAQFEGVAEEARRQALLLLAPKEHA